MKLKLTSYWYLVLFLAMAAVPALAQTNSRNAATVDPVAGLQQQIALQTSLLAGYHHQISDQAAVVEESWQLLISPEGSADEAGESIALSVNQKRLGALVRFLEDPIGIAEANLASLETKQAALMASANAHPPAVRHASPQERVLMASSPSGSAGPVKHGALSPRTAEARTRETESLKDPSR
jgi:hypothetical protein